MLTKSSACSFLVLIRWLILWIIVLEVLKLVAVSTYWDAVQSGKWWHMLHKEIYLVKTVIRCQNEIKNRSCCLLWVSDYCNLSFPMLRTQHSWLTTLAQHWKWSLNALKKAAIPFLPDVVTMATEARFRMILWKHYSLPIGQFAWLSQEWWGRCKVSKFVAMLI